MSLRYAVLVALAFVGCGDESEPSLPYATEVVSFEPGPGAGFGQAGLPEVVLGPPMGLGVGAGSIDVLSLGVGGSIVLGFAAPIIDGPGPDFVVFENPFFIGGASDALFAELGRVSV
ncbi:MAG: cell surface protein, partial [Myxococcota bacterium]